MPDTNLLLYAARQDLVQHEATRAWLDRAIRRDGLVLVDQVVVGVVRLATHERVFAEPSTPREIVEFIDALLRRPRVKSLRPGDRHLQRFRSLCVETGLTGNDVPDVYLAALALAEGCRLASADGGFSRFAGLDWINPLSPTG